jgi:hypothetical protein
MEEIVRLYLPFGTLVMLFIFINATPASADLPRLFLLCVMVLITLYLLFNLIEIISLIQTNTKKHISYSIMTSLIGMIVGSLLASIFPSKR